MGNCFAKPKTMESSDSIDHQQPTQTTILSTLNDAITTTMDTIETAAVQVYNRVDNSINPIHHMERSICNRLAKISGYTLIAIPVSCGAIALLKHTVQHLTQEPGVDPTFKMAILFMNNNMVPTMVLGVALGLFVTFRVFSRA